MLAEVLFTPRPLAGAAAGTSPSVTSDSAPAAVRHATVRFTEPSLDSWAVARRDTAEPISASPTLRHGVATRSIGLRGIRSRYARARGGGERRARTVYHDSVCRGRRGRRRGARR